jgi:hypothetical protein
MARPTHNPDEAFGSDSFLDIVANMVGILIILVIIAGLRAKGVPQQLIDAAVEVANEVRMLAAQRSSIEHETKRLNRETDAVQQAQSEREAEQAQLAAARDQLKEEVERRRRELSGHAQGDFDLRRKLKAAETKLARVNSELAEGAKVQPRVATKIENYPTPLSQTVSGKELHFQLRGDRILYVPLEELVELFKSEVRSRAYQLRDNNEAVDTIGPIAGFRMRFVLERIDVPVAVSSGGVMHSSFARLDEFMLLPVGDTIGETVDEAMQQGSQFRKRLADLTPQRTTVTLWTYPDSFTSYRAVRKALYLQGFTVAGRPLPEGQPIGGSPQGTKSAAQ